MPHTTSQKVQMRLTAAIDQLSLKAHSDARLKNLAGPSLTVTRNLVVIREEYRQLLRNEFPGCFLTFSGGRVKVWPPAGYIEVRGSVGAPVRGLLNIILSMQLGEAPC